MKEKNFEEERIKANINSWPFLLLEKLVFNFVLSC